MKNIKISIQDVLNYVNIIDDNNPLHRETSDALESMDLISKLQFINKNKCEKSDLSIPVNHSLFSNNINHILQELIPNFTKFDKVAGLQDLSQLTNSNDNVECLLVPGNYTASLITECPGVTQFEYNLKDMVYVGNKPITLTINEEKKSENIIDFIVRLNNQNIVCSGSYNTEKTKVDNSQVDKIIKKYNKKFSKNIDNKMDFLSDLNSNKEVYGAYLKIDETADKYSEHLKKILIDYKTLESSIGSHLLKYANNQKIKGDKLYTSQKVFVNTNIEPKKDNVFNLYMFISKIRKSKNGDSYQFNQVFTLGTEVYMTGMSSVMVK